MKIFHFCSYYVGSKVYRELIEALSTKSNVTQNVFVPIRDNAHLSNNLIEAKSVYFTHVKALSIFTKFSYTLKICSLLFSLIFSKAFRAFKESEVVHAHTLYADGIVAGILSIIFKKKFIITIRGTDINLGVKFFIHYRPLVNLVLKRAKSIVFISPAHQRKFHSIFGQAFITKEAVIPNGIERFYIDNDFKPCSKPDDEVIGLYVGAINKNKNLSSSIYAFFKAVGDKPATFQVVGGTAEEYNRVFGDLPNIARGKVAFLGNKDKEELIEYYRKAHLLVMPSFTETFGLVYIEALSQGTPSVFSEGQGIDGLFEDGKYGMKANPYSSESISIAIEKSLKKFKDGIEQEGVNEAKRFLWDNISSQYLESVYN